MDHISRVKQEPEEGQGNGIFLATRAVHRGAGGQDEAGQRLGDNKLIMQPKPLLQAYQKVCVKQSDNHNKTGVLVAEQQSTTQLRQEDQVSKTAHYNQSTTRVDVAFQAIVCYHSSDLIQDMTTHPRMGDQESLSSTCKKLMVDAAEQECLAQSKSVLQGVQMDGGDVLPSSEMSYTHFEACEEDRKASDKEVANGSKENTEVYLSKTHKAQTLLNKCKPIKLGVPVVAAQGKAVVAGGKHGEGKKGTKKYLPNDGWDALSADATPKPIESRKIGCLD